MYILYICIYYIYIYICMYIYIYLNWWFSSFSGKVIFSLFGPPTFACPSLGACVRLKLLLLGIYSLVFFCHNDA